jgi:hypothetical protein
VINPRWVQILVFGLALTAVGSIAGCGGSADAAPYCSNARLMLDSLHKLASDPSTTVTETSQRAAQQASAQLLALAKQSPSSIGQPATEMSKDLNQLLSLALSGGGSATSDIQAQARQLDIGYANAASKLSSSINAACP